MPCPIHPLSQPLHQPSRSTAQPPSRWHSAPVRASGRQRGFTMVELITVLILIGVLAAVALPRMGGALALRGAGWHDQVLAGLLHARTLAQGHRRLVCVVVATGDIRLSQASANPASACDTVLPGPDGDARWAVDATNLAISQAPAGALYFQPDGRITSDGAGSSAANTTISIAGEPDLQLTGETGLVE